MEKLLLSLPFIGKFLSERPTLLKIISNISWLSLDKVLRMWASLFVGVWVARYLTPVGYGVLNYAFAFASIFGVLASFGLDGIVVRELVKFPERASDILGTAFFLRLIGGLLTIILTVGFGFIFHNKNLEILGMLFFISLGYLFQSLLVIDYYFQSKIQSKYTVIAQNIAFFINLIYKVLLIFLHAPIIWFAVAYSFEIILGCIFLILFYKRNGLYIKKWRFERSLSIKLFSYSWPLMLSSLAIIIYMRTDQIMLKAMLGEKAVGLYSAAVNLSEVWYMIPMIISTSVFPAILEAKKIGEDLYYRRLSQFFSLMGWTAITIAIPISIFSGFIVNTLFGQEYTDSASVLAIHIWAGVPVFLGVARSQWIMAENLQKYAFYFTLLAAAMNICLNIIFIPFLGIIGAAAATLLSYIFSVFIFPLFFPLTRKSSFVLLRSILIWRR